MDVVRTLIEKVKAGYPALYMLTPEDSRAVACIEAAVEQMNLEPAKPGSTKTERRVFVWTLGKGLITKEEKKIGVKKVELIAKAVAETEDPDKVLMKAMALPQGSIVVLRHYHHFLEAPAIQALLIDLLPAFKASRRQIIVLTPVLKLPPELEKEFSLVEVPLPTQDEIYPIVDSFSTNFPDPGADVRKQLAENARGLTLSEAENAIALSVIRPNTDKKGPVVWDPKIVQDEKCETVKKSGFLTYYPENTIGFEQLGGMELFKTWLKKRAKVFQFPEKAAEFGLPIPKGVLTLGPPGTGKSLGAKVTANVFGLPLIRVDMGAIFGGIVGQSEANARAVIRFLEAVSPCIGWLDEIEKGFAGSSGGMLDSGVGARVLSTFLTWMQEKTAPVFVYATANNVAVLPPELLRKGRFDEMFFVNLPSMDEREAIFRIHIKKYGREQLLAGTETKPPRINVKQLAEQTDGFSGAEIEAVIRDGLFDSFEADSELNMLDLQEALTTITPLKKLMEQEIRALQKWAEGRCRPANLGDTITGKKARVVES
jgi:SpoVK/Ycf46/Vps4 family AAA+-type ATPase